MILNSFLKKKNFLFFKNLFYIDHIYKQIILTILLNFFYKNNIKFYEKLLFNGVFFSSIFNNFNKLLNLFNINKYKMFLILLIFFLNYVLIIFFI